MAASLRNRFETPTASRQDLAAVASATEAHAIVRHVGPDGLVKPGGRVQIIKKPELSDIWDADAQRPLDGVMFDTLTGNRFYALALPRAKDDALYTFVSRQTLRRMLAMGIPVPLTRAPITSKNLHSVRHLDLLSTGGVPEFHLARADPKTDLKSRHERLAMVLTYVQLAGPMLAAAGATVPLIVRLIEAATEVSTRPTNHVLRHCATLSRAVAAADRHCVAAANTEWNALTDAFDQATGGTDIMYLLVFSCSVLAIPLFLFMEERPIALWTAASVAAGMISTAMSMCLHPMMEGWPYLRTGVALVGLCLLSGFLTTWPSADARREHRANIERMLDGDA